MQKTITFLSFFLTTLSFGQNYSPIAVTGFNADVVAESIPAVSSTSVALDGSDYVLYNQAYGTAAGSGSGLPNSGLITNGASSYQLSAYSANNAIFLGTGETDSLELTTPASFSSLSLIGFSTEGSGTVLLVIKYTDGSATVINNSNLPDWFNNPNPVISGFDRTGRLTDSPDFQFSNPNIYRINVNIPCAEQSKLVEKVLIINTTSSPSIKTAVFALSGAPVTSASIVDFENVSCYNEGDGSINITAAGLTPLTYSWNTSPVTTTQDLNNIDAGSYTCVMTDATGCSITLNQTITEPAELASSQNAAICNGETFMVGPYSHTTSGTYMDVLTGVSGCDSTVTTILTVTTVNVGISSTTTNLSSNANGAQYQWLNCSTNYGIIDGATGQVFVPEENGAYAVSVTVNGCVDTSSCVVFMSAGLESLDLISLNLYPNPTNGWIQLDTEEAISTIELFDISGKTHAATIVDNAIDLTSLQNGIYIVKITSASGKTGISRVVKQ